MPVIEPVPVAGTSNALIAFVTVATVAPLLVDAL